MGEKLPNSVQLGAALRKIREARKPKLSIERVALDAGIDKSFLTDIELLNRNPSWETVRAVVEALDIDLDELMEVARSLPAAKSEADETEA